jgi:hypothetical protein
LPDNKKKKVFRILSNEFDFTIGVLVRLMLANDVHDERKGTVVNLTGLVEFKNRWELKDKCRQLGPVAFVDFKDDGDSACVRVFNVVYLLSSHGRYLNFCVLATIFYRLLIVIVVTPVHENVSHIRLQRGFVLLTP